MLTTEKKVIYPHFIQTASIVKIRITSVSDNSKYNGMKSITSQENLNTLINAIGSYEDTGAMSNAPFEIAIIKEKDVLYQSIDLKWTHYLDFRMETFRF